MTLNELKKECQVLGIEVKPSDARAPYLKALRAHYLKREFPNGLPYEELAPMLCFDYWSLHPKEQTAVWCDEKDWIAQQKLNGCRLILHFAKGLGVFVHSRTVSEHTYRRSELTDHLLFSSFIPDFTATIDSEALCDKFIDTQKGEPSKSSLYRTASLLHMEPEASKRIQKEHAAPLTVHAFDITNWKGTDLKTKRLSERLGYLEEFRAAIHQAKLDLHFAFPEIRLTNKKAFYEQIVKDGGEGVVFKHLDSLYADTNARSRRGWIKMKRQVEFDAYVSGFERGRAKSKWSNHISCLIFSVIVQDDIHCVIAKVSNLPWYLRKKASLYDPRADQLKMDLDLYGKVAHVQGLEISQRSLRLAHPRIVHWRSDLRQDQCRYSLAAIADAANGMPADSVMRIVESKEERR